MWRLRGLSVARLYAPWMSEATGPGPIARCSETDIDTLRLESSPRFEPASRIETSLRRRQVGWSRTNWRRPTTSSPRLPGDEYQVTGSFPRTSFIDMKAFH
jgi:hypothetical protein